MAKFEVRVHVSYSIDRHNIMFLFKKSALFMTLSLISTISPQVNQEIYSEEDLLAIDSSPGEVIDQLAVETFSDGQATVMLPPPSFNPTGKKLFILFKYRGKK